MQNLTFQNKFEPISLICHECNSNECTCLKNNNLHNGCINPQTSKPLQNEPRKVLYKSSNHFDPFELRGTCIEKNIQIWKCKRLRPLWTNFVIRPYQKGFTYRKH